MCQLSIIESNLEYYDIKLSGLTPSQASLRLLRDKSHRQALWGRTFWTASLPLSGPVSIHLSLCPQAAASILRLIDQLGLACQRSSPSHHDSTGVTMVSGSSLSSVNVVTVWLSMLDTQDPGSNLLWVSSGHVITQSMQCDSKTHLKQNLSLTIRISNCRVV